MQPLPSRTLATTTPLALAAALSLGAAAPALAQSPGSPPPPAKPAAAPPRPGAPAPAAPAKPDAASDADVAKLVSDGLKASKAGKWDQARALLARAYRVKKGWKLAGDLAAAEVGAQQFRDAAEHLYVALSEAPANLPDADKKALDALFMQAAAKVAALKFTVKPPNAEIFVNGVSVGKAPLDSPVFVDPGKVEVEAKADGFTAMRTQKAVTAGNEETFDLSLSRAMHLDAPPPRRTQEETTFDMLRTPIFIGGASAAGVLTVLGAALAITSDLKASNSHALEQPTATCGTTCASQFNALQSAKVNFAGGSMWSFIGAGALLLGTGAYVTVAVIQKPKPDVRDVRAGIVVAPGQAAASLTGRW